MPLTNSELIELLKPQYFQVRELPDKTIACLGKMFFTWNIFLGCSEYGWETCYFFEDFGVSLREFLFLNSSKDTPDGFVSRRPRF